MKVTIEATVIATIADEFRLMDVARAEVKATKAPEDWNLYFPDSPTGALELIIRQAIAERLLTLDCVVLHEIGHQVKDLDLPLK